MYECTGRTQVDPGAQVVRVEVRLQRFGVTPEWVEIPFTLVEVLNLSVRQLALMQMGVQVSQGAVPVPNGSSHPVTPDGRPTISLHRE